MKDRVRLLMQSEELSPGKFAEILGVQPSNISHLLSGRNKPGFDFIASVLSKFPELNPRWLILGEYPIYIRGEAVASPPGQLQNSTTIPKNESKDTAHLQHHMMKEEGSTPSIENDKDRIKPNRVGELSQCDTQIEQIILLSKAGTFKRYTPEE